jgi:hypothetical protein
LAGLKTPHTAGSSQKKTAAAPLLAANKNAVFTPSTSPISKKKKTNSLPKIAQ